jgi:hypothetical protein
MKQPSELESSYDRVARHYLAEDFDEAIDVTLMTHEEMLGYLRVAGFSDAKVIERDPYEFEYPTRRMYALAGKAMSQR